MTETSIETPQQRFERLSQQIERMNGNVDPQLKALLRELLGPAPTPLVQPPVDSDYFTPLWMQNESFSAQNDRVLMASLFSAAGGIVNPTDLAVAQRGAGANLSVDVAAGTGVVWGSDQANQFPYICRLNATKNVPLASVPPSGQERQDRIVVHVHDDAVTGSTGLPPWRLEPIQGANAPTGTSTPPAVPTSSLSLATVGPIVNTTSQVLTAMISDRRVRATRGLLGYGEDATSRSCPVTVWTTVPGTQITFTVPGARRVRYFFNCDLNKAAGDAVGQAGVSVWDITGSGVEMFRLFGYVQPGNNQTVSGERWITLAAGTYTWVVKVYSFNGFVNTGATAPTVLGVEDGGV